MKPTMPETHEEDLLDSRVFERIMKAAQFQELDRVPIWDHIDNWRITEYFTPGEKDPLRANVKAHNGLGIDLCRGFGASYAPEVNGDIVIEGAVGRRILGRTLWNNPLVKSLDELKSYHVNSPTDRDIDAYVELNRKYCEAFAPFTMWVPGCNVGFDIYYSVTNFRVFLAVKKISRWGENNYEGKERREFRVR